MKIEVMSIACGIVFVALLLLARIDIRQREIEPKMTVGFWIVMCLFFLARVMTIDADDLLFYDKLGLDIGVVTYCCATQVLTFAVWRIFIEVLYRRGQSIARIGGADAIVLMGFGVGLPLLDCFLVFAAMYVSMWIPLIVAAATTPGHDNNMMRLNIDRINRRAPMILFLSTAWLAYSVVTVSVLLGVWPFECLAV